MWGTELTLLEPLAPAIQKLVLQRVLMYLDYASATPME